MTQPVEPSKEQLSKSMARLYALIPYPSFAKCQQASADGIPVARLFMTALILLGRSTDYEHLEPMELFAIVVTAAKEGL